MNKTSNYYWMYSKHAIESAIQNPHRKVLNFLIEEKFLKYYKEFFFKQKIKKKIKIEVVSKPNIKKKIGNLAKYQGLALKVEKLQIRQNTIIEKDIKKEKLILIIDQLNDPNNLGALFRIAYAYAIKNIIILDRFMPEENAYIASIASGALDKINIIKVPNLVNIIKSLKKKNWWIVGLESKMFENCINLYEQNFYLQKKALVIGSESKGIRNLVRQNCDILCRIPIINDDLDSINVVQATSIALYEFNRKK